MAAKIPVVFSQGTNISPFQRDHEETLIAEMLMEDRIEVSLIAALEQLRDDDTDRLCLLGFQGDFVLMSSLQSSQVFVELERLGIEGQQGPTVFEPDGHLRSQQTRRKIYHVCVADRSRIEVRDEIQRLRADAQIQTVSITGIDGLATGAPATVVDEAPEPSPAPISSDDDPANNSAAHELPVLPVNTTETSPTELTEDDAMDVELDILVDKLDELDL
jgi:hypothetical protein